MCGIAGIIGKRDKAASQMMLEKIKHRGPDADGIWLSPINEFPASLCHTRLSILDLSEAGSQPFHSVDNRYVIVFNGEIYNYIELRDALISKYRISFRSRTDTEVLLYGFTLEGIDFLSKCNGMWAFCVWDRLENKATLCRDRFGVKPLYYIKINSGALGFSSEMKGLTPLLNSVHPSTNIESFFSNPFDYEFSDLCSINGISRIPGGSYAEFSNGKLEVTQWWNTLDHINRKDGAYPTLVNQWGELFTDSVKLRMRSDVRIGTALSGGLDSSSVLAVMAQIGRCEQHNQDRITHDWQHGICCSYPGSSLDETAWAARVAESCGVAFNSVAVNPIQSSWDLLHSLAQVEDPYITMPLPMLATYQAIKSLGVSVTLDGHGADELFSGYGHLNAALNCASSYNEYQEIIAIEASTRTGVFSRKEQESIKNRLRIHLKILLAKHKIFPRTILKSLLSREYEPENNLDAFSSRLFKARLEMRNHENFKAMDLFSQVLYEIFHLTILPTLLRNYDRYSMANGLEIRMPFMDWRLVCYTFSLPWQAKLGGSFTKRIQRDSLSGVLCDDIRLRRDKIGWNAPVHEWFRGPLRPSIEESLKNLNDTPYIRKGVKAWEIFNNISHPTFADGQQLWISILPQLWMNSLSSHVWS